VPLRPSQKQQREPGVKKPLGGGSIWSSPLFAFSTEKAASKDRGDRDP